MVDWRVLGHLCKFWTAMMVHAQVMLARKQLSPLMKLMKHLRIFLVDCIWDVWTAWETCSVSCGDGTQERSRMITVPAANGGIDCTGDATETHACNLGSCPGKGVEWYLFSALQTHIHTDTPLVAIQLTLLLLNFS